MNKVFLDELKTKAKTFGFNEKEVENVGTILSKLYENLTNDDCSSEEINNAVTLGVSIMQMGQSHSDRVLGISSNDHKKEVETLQKKIAELEGGQTTTEPKGTEDSSIPKEILDRLVALENQNKELSKNLTRSEETQLLEKRLSVLKDKLKDADKSFLSTTEKQFARMNFKDDDDFNSYLDDVVKDAQDFMQAQANKGLSSFTKIKTGNGGKEGVREIVADTIQQRLKDKGIIDNGVSQDK
jgi:hypothetical protein